MLDPVTNRYAEALFSLASKEGVLDAVRTDVEKLTRELGTTGAAEFFFDARVSADTRRAKLASVTGSMHPLVQNFVNLVFDKRREEVLRGLGDAFRARTLEAAGAAEGVVESARPLGASEIASLATALGARLEKSVTLENSINPDVLGGVRVIVGSKMIDHSVRGRLDGLAKNLYAAPLPTSVSASS